MKIPIGISKTTSVVKGHALIPLLVEVPGRDGSLTRASNLWQKTATTSCLVLKNNENLYYLETLLTKMYVNQKKFLHIH